MKDESMQANVYTPTIHKNIIINLLIRACLNNAEYSDSVAQICPQASEVKGILYSFCHSSAIHVGPVASEHLADICITKDIGIYARVHKIRKNTIFKKFGLKNFIRYSHKLKIYSSSQSSSNPPACFLALIANKTTITTNIKMSAITQIITRLIIPLNRLLPDELVSSLDPVDQLLSMSTSPPSTSSGSLPQVLVGTS